MEENSWCSAMFDDENSLTNQFPIFSLEFSWMHFKDLFVYLPYLLKFISPIVFDFAQIPSLLLMMKKKKKKRHFVDSGNRVSSHLLSVTFLFFCSSLLSFCQSLWFSGRHFTIVWEANRQAAKQQNYRRRRHGGVSLFLCNTSSVWVAFQAKLYFTFWINAYLFGNALTYRMTQTTLSSST